MSGPPRTAAGVPSAGVAAARHDARGAARSRGTRTDTRIELGSWVPLATVRVALVAAACVAFAIAPLPYAVIAVVLAVGGAVLPAGLLGWGAALVIALAQLAHPASLADPRSYLAVATVHLLHVLAGLCMVLPVRGRLQLRALIAPARRWVLIEIVAQPVLALALWARSAAYGGALGGGGAAVAVALCAVAIVVMLWLLARRR